MSVRRRPAARVEPLRKRPASKPEQELKTDRFTYLLELTAAQLRCLGLVELAYGYYYDGLVKVAGYITGLGRDTDYLEFKVTGTQTERLVEALSDPSRRTMQLHICPKDCSHSATGPDVLHAAGFWEVGDKKLPWHTLFEDVRAPPDEHDEMAKLREHYAARKKAVEGEKDSPSEEADKDKKSKKKRKKAKDKEKKPEKAKSDKEGTEEEPLFDRGQKALLAVVETRLERCSQPKGDVFPLPLASALGLQGKFIPSTDALIRALNLLYGTRTKLRTKEDNIRRKLTERTHGVVSNFSLLDQAMPQLDFHHLFQSKAVDYTGEEVQVARSFQWKMVEAAMPEAVGSLELEDFCGEGTLQYVRDFESFMLPAQDQRLGRTPAIMVEQRHWAEVCVGLLKRGVCRLMHVSSLHHIDGRPLFNGLFAVSKNETAVDCQGNSFEVCRLIMNLVPTNGCCRSLVGDTSTLPSVVGMSSVILEDSQLLITSSEDIRCFFYLFRTPSSWWKYMGFAREVPAEALPEGYTGGGWHLATQVLPMGFINSVAIAQRAHRRVINQALRGEKVLA